MFHTGTPRTAALSVRNVEGGQYWHEGLERGLRICFGQIEQSSSIAININIDGIPIFENGTHQFWPILFNVHGMPHIRPIIIGLFYGRNKPPKVEDFLDEFAIEAARILKSGLLINGHHLKVKILTFICDSPASRGHFFLQEQQALMRSMVARSVPPSEFGLHEFIAISFPKRFVHKERIYGFVQKLMLLIIKCTKRKLMGVQEKFS